MKTTPAGLCAMSDVTTIFYDTGERVFERDGRELRRWQAEPRAAGQRDSRESPAPISCPVPTLVEGASPPVTERAAPQGVGHAGQDFSPPLPHVRGSATSRAAAGAAGDFAATQEGRVLAFLRQRGAKGATSDEIEGALGIAHQSCGPRLRSLEKSGGIRRTAFTRPTRSGREAGILVAVTVTAKAAQHELFSP